MEHARRGEDALNSGKHEEAISHYTEAIKQTPSSPTYYIKRSIAYQRLSKTNDALHDAEVAVILAKKRAKRELIAQAQLRRGIAFYHLEKYGDAEFLFGVAKKLDSTDKSFEMWIAKVQLKMNNLSEGEESKKKVTVKEVPDIKEPGGDAVSGNITSKTETAADIPAVTQSAPASASTVTTPSAGVQTPANKIRHDWYQNNENVYITILAKGIPKDQASIEIEKDSMTVSFPLASGSSYDFSLEPLFAAVDPATSTSKIFSTKLEIVLKKSLPGQKWSSLEGTFTANVPTQSPSAEAGVDKPAPPATPATAPVYPTSSRTGPKNWDKIVNSYTKPPNSKDSSDKTTSNGKDDQANNDELVDDEEGDGVDRFFKQLYKGASDDTRRAMMKSYQESGGTALSTNWDEVRKAPVPISPPDGMEAKKW